MLAYAIAGGLLPIFLVLLVYATVKRHEKGNSLKEKAARPSTTPLGSIPEDEEA